MPTYQEDREYSGFGGIWDRFDSYLPPNLIDHSHNE
jgi:hypothetical protein